MIGVYSAPASGFMSLAPVADLGEDTAVALWRAGVRSGDPIRAAKGRALLIQSPSGPTVVRLDSSSVQEARREAFGALPYGEVILLDAAFSGRFTVFRRVEVLTAMSPEVAAKKEHVHLVSPRGVLLEKSLSPANPVDAKIISQRLGGQLQYAERVLFQPQLEAYVSDLKVDWGKLNAQQTAQKLAQIRTELHTMLNGVANKVMPTWTTTVDTSLKGVFDGTRKVLRNNFLPSVGLSLQQPDLRAIDAISKQQGWWMRDSAGYRSDLLTAKARNIVRDGLAQGLGRNEIGGILQRSLPTAWQAMGKRYFNTVAAVAVSRGRSYSEVSGYIEVGIEALEVQAVLDERTTETCRCLDGQVIETHVVSQQIVGAMNVANPEDIREASPFLKEVWNKESGLKEIVTANNGTKIAEVLRSGVGRVDDRGQFNYFRQGNQLADANIGPPPYHFGCRSWTIPVTTTISVPRNTVPQAQGPATPPVMRPKPKGGSRLPSMPSRPIAGVPKGTPTNPAVVGDPDLIERYPFTEDFFLPGALPREHFVAEHSNLMRNAASVQEYRIDQLSRSIRASGRMKAITPPTGVEAFAGEHRLVHLSKELSLNADVSGVLMHVQNVGNGTIRQVILAESKQAGAHRVYSLRSADSGLNKYLKFNADKKRAADKYLKALRKAQTNEEIKAAFAGMEKEGYVKITGRWDRINFGPPAPPLPPTKVPKPKPTPKPKSKPKPPTEPTVRPKPKPTTTEVSPTGEIQAPKRKPRRKPTEPIPTTPNSAGPGGAKDYQQYGLLDEKVHSLKEQVLVRSKFEAARIKDMLKSLEAKFTPGMTAAAKEKAKSEAIQKFWKADTGAVERITAAEYRKGMTKQLSNANFEVSKQVKESLADQSMGLLPGKREIEVKIKRLSWKDSAKLVNGAAENLSQRMMDAARKRGFPAIYEAEGISGGAFYNSTYNLIVIPQRSTYKFTESTFKHEFGHYADELAHKASVRASTTFRNLHATSEPLSGPGYSYVNGKWGDTYAGRIYESEKGSEVVTTFMETVDATRTKDLLRMFEANPEHAGYALAHSKGAFIP